MNNLATIPGLVKIDAAQLKEFIALSHLTVGPTPVYPLFARLEGLAVDPEAEAPKSSTAFIGFVAADDKTAFGAKTHQALDQAWHVIDKPRSIRERLRAALRDVRSTITDEEFDRLDLSAYEAAESFDPKIAAGAVWNQVQHARNTFAAGGTV